MGSSGTERKKRGSFEREHGATRYVSGSDLGQARKPNGLDALSFFAWSNMRFRMWPEVGHSVAAGGQRVPQDDIVVTWATAKWIVQAQCCRNRMTSVHSRGLLISRWNWIRAWNSGEPETILSAARTVECAALPCSRVSWTPRDDELCSWVSLACLACLTVASSRHHALGRRAVSMLKMTDFSFCKIAPSEPSRGGVGTWRWQVRSQAAPRRQRVRVHHEPTWIKTGEQRPGKTCQPRTTRWSDGPGPAHIKVD